MLWSIALPGFGQLLNGHFAKGLLLIALEFLVNVKSNLNIAIQSSFHGDMLRAVDHTDYQWLMFYPCVYLYAIWDAYRDACGGSTAYSYLPFVGSAYLGTIGVIYSSDPFLGISFGPIWLPILFMWLGVLLGWMLKKMLLRSRS
ncbi:MAG: hypothetical protein ACXVP5_11575 [Tumebacillaceae bacterium]